MRKISYQNNNKKLFIFFDLKHYQKNPLRKIPIHFIPLNFNSPFLALNSLFIIIQLYILIFTILS